MSRSLGDRIGHTCGVSSEAEIKHFSITQDSIAIVMGSDGLWDVVSNKEIAKVIDIHKSLRQADKAASELLELSKRNWKIKVDSVL